jgi:Fe-S-cluster containining protein
MMADSHREILTRADAHFARVASDEREALSCRPGCSLCCQALFEIGAADVAVVAQGIRELPPQRRAVVVERARRIAGNLAHPDLRKTTKEEREAFFARAGDVTCPALDERGGCSIYAHRPLACRTYGLPLRGAPEYLGQECELNFLGEAAAGEEHAAWDLQWEDEVGPEDQYTVPEPIILAARLIS